MLSHNKIKWANIAYKHFPELGNWKRRNLYGADGSEEKSLP